MEKMREEFEAWCASHGYTLRPAETNCGIAIEGQYGNQRVQIAWEAWKASRAALCVEIPTCGEASSFGDYVVFDSDDVRTMLDDAGIRYT